MVWEKVTCTVMSSPAWYSLSAPAVVVTSTPDTVSALSAAASRRPSVSPPPRTPAISSIARAVMAMLRRLRLRLRRIIGLPTSRCYAGRARRCRRRLGRGGGGGGQSGQRTTRPAAGCVAGAGGWVIPR